jgi:hypothetical protein
VSVAITAINSLRGAHTREPCDNVFEINLAD